MSSPHDGDDGSRSLPAKALAAGTYDVRSHPRVRVLLEGLRDHGLDVEEIVEPLRLSTAERVEVLRRPSKLPRLVVALLRSWIRLVPRLVRRRRHAPRPLAVLVGYLGQFDAPLVRLLTRPVPQVLDFLVSGTGTAADRGETGGIKQALLRSLDLVALRSADIVLVDTVEHLEALPAAHRGRALVIPVGADESWFASGHTKADAGDEEPSPVDEPMSVVFFGLFTPLQGAPVIARALRELDGLVRATLIGGGQDEAEVDRLLEGVPSITRIPWVDAADLPDVVARHDVCLGIFGPGEKARRVVPNKVYQGAAAGCVIVTSDTPPQRRMLGETVVYVPAGSAHGLARALRELAAEPERRRALVSASTALARERFTPAAVVQPLVRQLRGQA